jgi:hypothetical protein
MILILITGAVLWTIPLEEAWGPTKVDKPLEIESYYRNGVQFIEMTADTLYYSGYDYIVNGKVRGSYYYHIYDGVCVFYLISPGMTDGKAEVLRQVHMKARLESGNRMIAELTRRMAEDLRWTRQGLAEAALHVSVNQAVYFSWKMLMAWGVHMVLFAASMAEGLFLLLCFLFPVFYPGCARLRRYGAVHKQLDQVEKELEDAEVMFGNLVLTKNYLIECSGSSMQMIPLAQIVWAYHYSHFHHFRLWREKLSYTVRIVGNRRVKLIFRHFIKEDADDLMKYLEDSCPHVRIGYSRENDFNFAHFERSDGGRKE